MIEQLSLFDDFDKSICDKFADRILAEFNKLDTIWKGSFYVSDIELSFWSHYKTKNKILWITIQSKINRRYDIPENFCYWGTHKKDQRKLFAIGNESEFIGKLVDDKDFKLTICPTLIFVAYYNFERKKLDL